MRRSVEINMGDAGVKQSHPMNRVHSMATADYAVVAFVNIK